MNIYFIRLWIYTSSAKSVLLRFLTRADWRIADIPINTDRIAGGGRDKETLAVVSVHHNNSQLSTGMNEIERRRTFAIIAHPDAGKTSLTEKLLLFGGQIQVAGAVKSNKIKKTATSDWMDIEKQRGISVTTSVMEFDYHGYKVNILDTPGHQDLRKTLTVHLQR